MKHEAKVKKLSALVCFSVLLVGCASTPEYVKNLKVEDYLYSDYVTFDKTKDLESIALSVGSDRTGFIPPDRSEDRKSFEKKYPIALPSADDYENIEGYRIERRIGQVLRLSADLDKRTSGFIRNESGQPISVSGMVKVTTEPFATGVLTGGASQVIATSTSSSTAINPTQSAGYNIGAGLGLGFIVGAIHSLQVDSAIRGIISKDDFGSRMEETTPVPSMPTATRLSSVVWKKRGKTTPIKVTDGIIKVIYEVDGGKNIRYKNNIFLLSTVAVYRGNSFKLKYPETEGWEFRITNINLIEVPEVDEGELKYRAIKKALTEKEITL